MEELLREISEKLSILIEKIDSNHDPINHALENINQHFETIYEKRRDFIDFGTDLATNNMQLEKEISDKKNLIISAWKRNLNERKQAFWNALKTENTVNIFKKWRQHENIIIPRKFRIKTVAREDETERAIRENLALQKFDAEIALLETRTTRYTTRFQNIDLEMENEIKKISTGEIQNHLLKKWKKDTDDEEEKSNFIWTKKKFFYDNYEENYGTIDLDRNNKPKRNRSWKPTQKYQHRNTKTYAEIIVNENMQHKRQDIKKRILRSATITQRHAGNWNKRKNFQKPVETVNQREPLTQGRYVTQNKNNDNYNVNHNNRSNQGKPFLWKGKIQKYRWKSIA